jgi:4'-phosphopantetheinyl transferase
MRRMESVNKAGFLLQGTAEDFLRKVHESHRSLRSGGEWTGIDVWSLPLEPFYEAATELRNVLSADELERASRFRLTRLQKSFVITRGILRILVGQYVGSGPGEIEFRYGFAGKPFVYAHPPLHFNLSHSGEHVVLAFSQECAVGIDVEQMRSLDDMESLSRLIFAGEELLYLEELSGEQRDRAFYRGWCRKEALAKAEGCGLSEAFQRLQVPLEAFFNPRTVVIRGTAWMPENWSLHDVEVSAEHTAALAYKGPVCDVHLISL